MRQLCTEQTEENNIILVSCVSGFYRSVYKSVFTAHVQSVWSISS